MKLDVLKGARGNRTGSSATCIRSWLPARTRAGAHALLHAVVPPGGGPPPHVHRREDEACCVLEGELMFHADDRDIAATAGAWVTLPKGSLHSFKNNGPESATMLIVVTPSGLERFFAEVGQEATDRSSPPSVTPADVERLPAVAPRYGIETSPPA